MSTIQNLIKHIDERTIGQVIIVEGEETYLFDKIIQALMIRQFGKPEITNQLQWESYTIPETPIINVLQSLRTLPFMAENKTVILKNAELIKAKQEIEILHDYVHNPSPKNIFAIFAKKLPQNAIWKKILTKTSKTEAIPLKEYQLPEWIKSELKKRKLLLSEDAVQYLAYAIGPNLNLIDQAVNKLELTYTEKTRIEINDVKLCIENVKQRSVFELTDAISTKDLHTQLKLIQTLIEQKESPVAINAVIAKHIVQLMQVKDGLTKNLNDNEIIAKMKMNPYVFKKIKNNARNHQLEKLQKFHADTYDTDKKLKDWKMDKLVILQNMLINNHHEKK